MRLWNSWRLVLGRSHGRSACRKRAVGERINPIRIDWRLHLAGNSETIRAWFQRTLYRDSLFAPLRSPDCPPGSDLRRLAAVPSPEAQYSANLGLHGHESRRQRTLDTNMEDEPDRAIATTHLLDRRTTVGINSSGVIQFAHESSTRHTTDADTFFRVAYAGRPGPGCPGRFCEGDSTNPVGQVLRLPRP